MAALDGCWWPLEVASPAVQSAALVVPTGRAMAALHQLITFGTGFAGAREEIRQTLVGLGWSEMVDFVAVA